MLTQGNVVEPYSNWRSESRGSGVCKMASTMSRTLTDASMQNIVRRFSIPLHRLIFSV